LSLEDAVEGAVMASAEEHVQALEDEATSNLASETEENSAPPAEGHPNE
jgi:hypothetical protein